MDERTISGYFIGYLEKLKGYIFYCPAHSTRIVEIGNAQFIENGETSGSEASRNMEIKEVRVQVPVGSTSLSRVVVPYVVEKTHNNQEEEQISDPEVNNGPILEQPQEMLLRSHRDRKSSISNDYVVYLQESESDLSIDNEPVSSNKWLDAMKDELKSMAHNDIWDLVELLEGCKRVGYTLVFKTKHDS